MIINKYKRKASIAALTGWTGYPRSSWYYRPSNGKRGIQPVYTGRWVDNVFIERFWRSLKYEKVYLEPSEDGHELYEKIKWYMVFYNTRRPHQTLNYLKPEQLYAQAV